MKNTIQTLALALCLTGASTTLAKADPDPFIGTVMQVGENYCPRGWAQTNGQLLAIASHTALFSLLGTMYGGDGRTTFALPDLRGRYNMHAGRGPGLTQRNQGARLGTPTVTHSIMNLAPHSHALVGTITATVKASSNAPDDASPNNAYKPTFPAGTPLYADSGSPNVTMGAGSVNFTNGVSFSTSGDQQSITNEQPYLALTSCIALVGVYPSRS